MTSSALSHAQLGSSWYFFATPIHVGYGFGLICALTSIVGFRAAQGHRRVLLRLGRVLPL